MSPVSAGLKRAHRFVPTLTRWASTALNTHETRKPASQDDSCPGSSLSESSSSNSPHLKSIKRALSALLRRPPSDESMEEFNRLRQLALTTDAIQSKQIHELLLQAAAHERQPRVVTELFKLAHQQSRKFRINVYEHISYQFAETKQWGFVRFFAELGRAHVGRWSTRLLDWRIRSLAELEEYTSLHDAISWYVQDGLTPSRRTFEILVKTSLSNRDITWAAQILCQMQQFGIPFEASTYTAILAGCRAFGPCIDVEARCFAVLKNMGALRRIDVVNTLVRLRLDANDPEGARRIMNAAQSEKTLASELESTYFGKPRGDSGYRTPFQAFPPDPRIPLAPSASGSNSGPNIVTYDILLREAGTLDRALSVYNKMLLHGIHPSERTISSLLYVIFKVSPSHWEDAIRIASVAIHGYNSKKGVEFCHKLGVTSMEFSSQFSGIRIAPVTPTVPFFNSLLGGLLSVDPQSMDGLSTAFKRFNIIVRRMRRISLEPDEETAQILMNFLRAETGSTPSQLTKVLACLTSSEDVKWNRTLASPSHDVQSSSPVPSSPLVHDHSRPSTLFQSHQTAGPVKLDGWDPFGVHAKPLKVGPLISPTLGHVNTVLQNINQRGQFWLSMKGQRILHQIRERTHPRKLAAIRIEFDRFFTSHAAIDPMPSEVHPASSPITPDSVAIDALVPQFDSLRRRGVRNDSWGFGLRMSHESLTEQAAARVQRTFDAMVTHGIRPLSSHYATLMKAFADSGDLHTTKSIFAVALASGVAVTVAMFTVLIVAYGRVGDPHGAHRAFNDMLNHGVKGDVASLDALASAYVRCGQKNEAREALLRHWNAVVPADALRSDANLRDLTLKMLFQLLRGLSGAQRKARRPNAARRVLTKRLVRRVLQTWVGDSPKVPPRPRMSRSMEMRQMRQSRLLDAA